MRGLRIYPWFQDLVPGLSCLSMLRILATSALMDTFDDDLSATHLQTYRIEDVFIFRTSKLFQED